MDRRSIDAWLAQHRWALVRLAGFALVTVVLAFGDPRRIGREIAGDAGDAYLILATLEWGGQRAGHLFQGYWDGPFFATGHTVMAYSDTLLPLTVPFGVLERITGSRVLAFNALYLASWILCAEATYRLGLRLIASRTAAVVAAIAFTFSTIRLEQAAHFQLTWAGFIPVSVLLLFRLRDRPTVWRGLALAAAVIIQMLTSAYYGVIVIVFVAAVVGLDLLVAAFRDQWRARLPGAAAFFGALVLVMLPVQHMYSQAERSHEPRSGYPAHGALQLGDLRMPSPTARVPRAVPIFDRASGGRSENYAYVGLLVIVLVPAAVALVVRGRGRIGWSRPSTQEWALLLALGALGFALAVGRRPVFGVELPVYDLGVRVIPGLDQMVAIVRLVIFTQLALVLVASWALARLVAGITVPVRTAVTLGLVAFLIAEAHQTHRFVRVVSPEPRSVYAAMQQLDAGVVVELPLAGREIGAAYAFIESTRAVLGSDDDLQLVNGYSGHAPNGYDAIVATLNTFPDPGAMQLIEDLGIDYVVLHTAPITTGMRDLDPAFDGTGYTFVDPSEAERRIAELPASTVAERIDADDGVILVLAD